LTTDSNLATSHLSFQGAHKHPFQTIDKLFQINLLIDGNSFGGIGILGRKSQPINAGHGRHYDNVLPFQQSTGGSMAESIDPSLTEHFLAMYVPVVSTKDSGTYEL
jgi:hypothetical protein